MTRMFKTFAPALVVACFAPGAALAVDPAAFAAKVEALMEGSQVDFLLGTGTETADGLSFPDAKMVFRGDESGPDEIPVPLTLSGVTELADGGYTVETITTPDISFADEDEDLAFSAVDFRIEHVNIAGTPGSTEFTEGMFRDTMASVGRIGMTYKGEEAWSIGAVTIAASIEGDAGTPIRSEAQFAIDDVFVNFAVNPNDELEDLTKAFDQSEFTGRITGGASFDLGSTLIGLDSLKVTLDGLGELNLDFASGGWTPQLLAGLEEALTKLQALEASGGKAEDVAKAQTALGMQILVSLTFVGGGLSYEDHGFVNKLIDFIAESENEERATITAGLNIMAVQGLVQAGLTDLAARVSTEVSKFLANPQSFEISARPAAPVSLILLSAAAVQPQLILDMLKVNIAANTGGPAVDSETEPGPARVDRPDRPEREDDAAPRGGIPRVQRN